MFYNSTRNSDVKVNSAEAITQGISAEGGLFVPESIPQLSLDEIKAIGDMKYADRAAYVFSKYLTDFTEAEIHYCTDNAYSTKNFETESIAEIAHLFDGTYMLELWHGPTCAFKDMALQLLPHLLTRSSAKVGEGKRTVILVATSGDTGKAALEGFKHEGLVASSANSINIGRLAPQTAYYFAAYGDMVANGTIEFGREVDFVVPTGNFGNILAGYMAKRMGLPVGKLICASNANDVLYQFLSEGVYDRASRQLIKTASPSMDILISSNLERLLFFMANRGSEAADAALVASLMAQLKETGRYALPDDMLERIRAQFLCGRADDNAAFAAIRDMWQNSHYLMDTHTAVAYSVYAQLKAKGLITAPAVVLSTASPFKFAPAMLKALGEYANESGFDAADKLSALTGLAIPAGLGGIRELSVLHTDVIDPAEMGAYIHSVL